MKYRNQEMVKIFKKYCRGFVVNDLLIQCKVFSTHFFCNKLIPKLLKKIFLESVWHWNFLSFLKDWKITYIITNLGRKCKFQCHSNFRTVFDRANGRLKIYPVKKGSTQLRLLPLLALVISLVLSLKCRHYRKKIDIGHVHLMFTKWSLILGKIYLKNTACIQLQCLHFEYLVNQIFFHAQFSCLCI